ncbi:MAG: energy-coupling factor ABC transporter ATP-binding protein [Eubacterium sp.]|nr:energy-coupling factor ABC transporter ATP-binding protein [Eubacterium sp.]
MISFSDVSFGYGDNDEILKHINLTIKEGETVLICGPSGCGKSSLARCVNGLIPHFYGGKLTGSISVNNTDIKTTPLRKISKQVGTVFQNPRSQFFNVDTTSELAFGCENFNLDPKEIEKRINNVVNRHNMAHLMDRSIFDLSGGEKQKIACASVAVEPLEVIVLDEPSANLDYKGICELQRMIEAWQKEKKTILIAEHRIAYLMPYIDRAIMLKNGEISKEYTAYEFKNLTSKELNKMGLRGKIFNDPQDMAIVSENKKEYTFKSEKMVLKNMRFAYRKQPPIFDLSEMQLPRGEVIAVVGKNGCGKSTFLRCLCGLEKSCKAVLEYGDKRWKNKERRKNIYMVMQDVNHQLFTDSVLEEVMISQEKENKESAMEILKMLDLEKEAEKHPLALSGGQKQRVAVASALASDRDIILFDEPTSGLDYYHMLQVSELLKKLQKAGKTLIIVTHDEELIRHACTEIINLGEILCQEIKAIPTFA